MNGENEIGEPYEVTSQGCDPPALEEYTTFYTRRICFTAPAPKLVETVLTAVQLSNSVLPPANPVWAF